MSDWEGLSPAEMAERLAAALAADLPGRAAHRTMAHRLAYGRHHGPMQGGVRRAAVLVALNPQPSGWSLPAILRPDTMKAHASQVSLPGGVVEADETAVQAALREFEEELGSQQHVWQIIGQLTPVCVFVSGFEITPVLAVSHQRLLFEPNPQEVAAVVELSLAELCDPTCRRRHLIERRGLVFSVPHFAVGGQQIWGATSLILAEFVALLTSTASPS